MDHHLFPQEIIENTQEHNFSAHSVQSRIIYSTIVLSLIGIIAATPFIYTDVGIRSRGMIRPVTEVVKIASPVTAQITSLKAKENSYVKKGSILATLNNADIAEKLQLNRSRFEKLVTYLEDLSLLTEVDDFSSLAINDLKSVRFQREAQEFGQQLANQQQVIDQHNRLLERGRRLFDRDAISLVTLEERRHTLQLEINQLKLLTEQQRNNWNQQQETYQRELDELNAERNQLMNESQRYIIRSPISGTLLNTNSLLENSFVFANQAIGEISPDTSMVAEIYVTPNDVGLLSEDMSVRFQIDAYDHNQWGKATGKIESISTDMIMNDNTPVFKVRCSIDQSFLELPNGFRGDIKKGMTLQARFILNQRSLFQLLYDNMDDWLNPAWSATGEDVTAANS